MRQWSRSAPCKINLALDVLGSRSDGYHDMYMVMQSISLCDTVTVREREEGFSLLARGLELPEGKKTLEQRAAEAFFAFAGRPMPGLEVELEKVTPAFAGLGGGSADVAALLRILRDVYAPQITQEELEHIGFQVGSEMPFCIHGGTALAEGRGEILTDLPPLPPCWIVLAKPEFGISTPTLFARLHEEGENKRPDIHGMVEALGQGDLEGIARRLGNVFEEVLPQECGEVFRIKEQMLSLGALGAAMSGSGPTVFGLFREEEIAQRAANALKANYPQTFLARPVGRFTE